jgi:hypothetical protein
MIGGGGRDIIYILIWLQDLETRRKAFDSPLLEGESISQSGTSTSNHQEYYAINSEPSVLRVFV